MASWLGEGHGSRGARVSLLKHRAQGRGLIQVEGNTAFSHGCAKIYAIFFFLTSIEPRVLTLVLHIAEVLEE